MIEQITIPRIKKGTTVVWRMLVFLISKKYTIGTVNNKSNVIPVDKLFGFVAKIDDFAMRTIIRIIDNGIPNIIKFF